MHKVLKDKKFIFFDMGYTLVKPYSGHWLFPNKFLELAKEKMESRSKEEIKSAVIAGLEYSEKHHLMETIEEEISTLQVFYKIISDGLHLELTDKEIQEIAQDRSTNMENFILYPKVKETLEELSKTYQLGIISDTWPSIKNILKHFKIEQYFTTFTFSYELGVFKPDDKMYIDAINKCGVEAKDTIFVDDNIFNLKGADKFGITPVLIAANPHSDIDTEYTKIYSVADLLD